MRDRIGDYYRARVSRARFLHELLVLLFCVRDCFRAQGLGYLRSSASYTSQGLRVVLGFSRGSVIGWCKLLVRSHSSGLGSVGAISGQISQKLQAIVPVHLESLGIGLC